MSLPRSLSAKALEERWNASRDSKRLKAGAPGVDRVQAVDFGQKLKAQVSALRSDIQKQSFFFRDLRIAPIPKASGGHRIIAVPTVRDRLLQRALLQHLEDDKRYPRPSQISYGFCKGRTLSDAQRQALVLRNSQHWILKVDITKFFDNIRRTDVKRLIRKHVRSKIVGSLLCAAVECELEDTPEGNPIAATCGIRRGRGLRQGMPISPMLSNLLLRDFDSMLVSKEVSAVRYADDIAVFASSRSACQDALSLIREKLQQIGLDVPELTEGRKTMFYTPSEPAEFLGVELRLFDNCYKLVASGKKLQHIEKEMDNISSIPYCIENKKSLGQVVRALDMFVIGHGASMQALDDPSSFLDRLNSLKTKKVKALLAGLLGNDVLKRLDDRTLAILGVKDFQI